ncbi:MAG: cation diffusion facilitator family transporter [Eubacteriales bacterium]|nr:cation diffusion facilitator family transporter [Eubacteriales bacterium]
MSEQSIIRRVSGVGIFGNIILVAFKLYAGIAGHSAAMVSDAVHSLSDVFATFIAYIGIRISRKEADKAHPYGHDRLECVASMILGVILLATGLGIGAGGVKTILQGNYEAIAIPSTIALIAAVVSIVTKEAMFWYTRHYAKKLNSSAFMADAWHHRSDALSSVGSLIGIGGAMLGALVLEPIACVVICLCILKVAYDILKDALERMLDTACSDEFEAELKTLITAQDGVLCLDRLQTRKFGSKIYIDAEIAVDGAATLTDAHTIAHTVHDAVENAYPDIKHIMIHENPAPEEAAI